MVFCLSCIVNSGIRQKQSPVDGAAKWLFDAGVFLTCHVLRRVQFSLKKQINPLQVETSGKMRVSVSFD